MSLLRTVTNLQQKYTFSNDVLSNMHSDSWSWLGKWHIAGSVTMLSCVCLCGGGCELNLTHTAIFRSISLYCYWWERKGQSCCFCLLLLLTALYMPPIHILFPFYTSPWTWPTKTHTQNLAFSLCNRGLNTFELLYSRNLSQSQD